MAVSILFSGELLELTLQVRPRYVAPMELTRIIFSDVVRAVRRSNFLEGARNNIES